MAEEPLPQAPSPIRLDVETGEHDDGLTAFASVRRCLFSIAYRMLGSAAEAEDILQEVWVRWQSTNRRAVENPSAFLVKTTSRLCISLAQSAPTRRETSVGTWLPEPVDTSGDPGTGAERGEVLQLAVLVLLEKLSPKERAAYVLREAFDYAYSEIAGLLRMEEANIRQIVSRARKHIADSRRTPANPDEQRRLLEVFLGAAQKGDIAALEDLFAEDIVSCSGGGGLYARRGSRFMAASASRSSSPRHHTPVRA
jgi:RNA polymerase sigma-70 factor (ECF subfamily)